MAAVGTVIGTPVGILAGTYLAEYGQRGWLAPATRFSQRRAAVGAVASSSACSSTPMYVLPGRPLLGLRLARWRWPFW